MNREKRSAEIRAQIRALEAELQDVLRGCRKPLAPETYFAACGDTDMGQSAPAFCTECGGDMPLAHRDSG